MDAAAVTELAERCDAIVDELESFLGGGVGREPGWSRFPGPVVDRGEHAVIPLVVAASGVDVSAGSTFAELAQALRRRWGFRYGGHDFRVGTFSDADEWGRRALALALAERGARQPIWWLIGDRAVVFAAIVDIGGQPSALALHVVPSDWVLAGNVVTPSRKRELSHARRIARTVAAADLRWDADALVSGPGELWVSPRPVD
jgi:hypothetical protein